MKPGLLIYLSYSQEKQGCNVLSYPDFMKGEVVERDGH